MDLTLINVEADTCMTCTLILAADIYDMYCCVIRVSWSR